MSGDNKREDPPWSGNGEIKPVVKAMSPAQKLNAAWQLNVSARQRKAAALRAQHPDWTEEQIRRAVREAFLYARG